MKTLAKIINFLGSLSLFIQNMIKSAWTGPFYIKNFIEQIYTIGNRSLLIVLVVGACFGTILTLQIGLSMARFGATIYVPQLLAISIFREFAPVFTSIILAGRVGSGMAAEVGSMKLSQQLDALRAMGLDPFNKIVIPRFLASLVIVPILCLFSSVVAISFGALTGLIDLNIDVFYFLVKVFSITDIHDFISGFYKCYFFACFISLTACYYGFQVKTSYDVGEAATQTVVSSSILIVISDYFLTKFYWITFLA